MRYWVVLLAIALIAIPIPVSGESTVSTLGTNPYDDRGMLRLATEKAVFRASEEIHAIVYLQPVTADTTYDVEWVLQRGADEAPQRRAERVLIETSWPGAYLHTCVPAGIVEEGGGVARLTLLLNGQEAEHFTLVTSRSDTPIYRCVGDPGQRV